MNTLVLEPSAVVKVAALAAEDGSDLALVVSVQSGGCSGFRYEMFFADPSDGEYAEFHRSEHAEGAACVTVLVDAASAPLLQGASLRFEDGLQGAGFKIENPNAKRSCGCGQSFS
jgi:iron-sulfur cluster assembly accessory protein